MTPMASWTTHAANSPSAIVLRPVTWARCQSERIAIAAIGVATSEIAAEKKWNIVNVPSRDPHAKAPNPTAAMPPTSNSRTVEGASLRKMRPAGIVRKTPAPRLTSAIETRQVSLKGSTRDGCSESLSQ